MKDKGKPRWWGEENTRGYGAGKKAGEGSFPVPTRDAGLGESRHSRSARKGSWSKEGDESVKFKGGHLERRRRRVNAARRRKNTIGPTGEGQEK